MSSAEAEAKAEAEVEAEVEAEAEEWGDEEEEVVVTDEEEGAQAVGGAGECVGDNFGEDDIEEEVDMAAEG